MSVCARMLAQKSASQLNSFDLMKHGRMRYPQAQRTIEAQFDFIHVDQNCPIFGSLRADSQVHHLAMALRSFLVNEVFGQFDNPALDADPHHRWSKPHITLSDATWPWNRQNRKVRRGRDHCSTNGGNIQPLQRLPPATVFTLSHGEPIPTTNFAPTWF